MNKKMIIIGIASIAALAVISILIAFLRGRGSDDVATNIRGTNVLEGAENTSTQVAVSTAIAESLTVDELRLRSASSAKFLGITDRDYSLSDAEAEALIASDTGVVRFTQDIDSSSADSTTGTSTSADLDSDSDTIPDSEEVRYGTDPKKADTDGDTFPDADEIKNGYNPLGTGKCAVTTCLIN